MAVLNPIALAEDGKNEYGKGNFVAAADLFWQAAQSYKSAKDELNAAEMMNNQSVALLQAGKAREALQATEGTEEIFQKAGDIKRQGIAVSNRAAALEESASLEGLVTPDLIAATLTDPVTSVRSKALAVAAQLPNERYIPQIINCLKAPDLRLAARSALATYSATASLAALEAALARECPLAERRMLAPGSV